MLCWHVVPKEGILAEKRHKTGYNELLGDRRGFGDLVLILKADAATLCSTSTSGTTKLTQTKYSDLVALVSEEGGLILKASQSTLDPCDCNLGLHASSSPTSLPRVGRLGITRRQVPAAPRGNL